MTEPNFLFLIRAYNESSRIGGVVEAILAAGYRNILVVDDGSRDDTRVVLARFQEIMVARHAFNRGGGAALETGLEFVRRHADDLGITHVVTFDGDGQHDIADMEKFRAAIVAEPDTPVFLGSRFVQKTNSNVPFLRRLILEGGKWFTCFLSGADLTDAHNGYRILRVDVVRRIRLTMDGMEYASELIDEIMRLRIPFREVPVNVSYDLYTLGKGQRNGNAINIAMKMLYRKFFDS